MQDRQPTRTLITSGPKNGVRSPSFPRLDPYTGEPIAPEGDEEAITEEDGLEIAEAIFPKVAERRLQEERATGFELRAYRELLTTAFGYFRHSSSQVGLEHGPALVAVEPAMAQTYALYLAALASSDEADETSSRVLEVVGRFGGYTTPWVQAWLVEPFLAPNVHITEEAEQWLRELLYGGTPGVLRSRAAVALAAHGRIDPGDLTALFDELPSAARPDIAAGLAFLRLDPEHASVRSVVESEHLYRMVFDYASANAIDVRWA